MKKQRSAPPPDIRVMVSFKNNLILVLMRERGYETVAELSRASGISQSVLGHFINMRERPVTNVGEWRVAVTKLADFFGCLPGDLFSGFQQENALEKNRTHAEMHFGEVQAMLAAQNADLLNPFTLAEKEEMKRVFAEVLNTLSPRRQEVLRLRFGLDGPEMTFKEIGQKLGIGPARAQQIEAKALRLMRHPSRAERVRDFFEDSE